MLMNYEHFISKLRIIGLISVTEDVGCVRFSDGQLETECQEFYRGRGGYSLDMEAPGGKDFHVVFGMS